MMQLHPIPEAASRKNVKTRQASEMPRTVGF